MAFRCPSCGGDLYYDISKKDLCCKHCNNHTSIEEYHINNDAQEIPNLDGQTAYICKNCGAELISPDESIVSFCSYCGGEQLLAGKIQGEFRPRRIIPFEKTKSHCKEAYRKVTQGKLYVPKELKDPEYLEKFRGIYIPYWNYGMGFEDAATVKAYKKKRSGNYVTETTYNVTAEIKGSPAGVPYDASSYFDDTSASQLMPFDRKKAVDFDGAYLAGFYADNPDVDPATYLREVSEKASEDAFLSIEKSLKRDSLKLTDEPTTMKVNRLRPSMRESFTELFPVWFLTWRNKDRVAYAIMNGQTGKLLADLPVDLSQYGKVTAIMALAIFAILSIFVSMTARTALSLCAFLTLIVAMLFRAEAAKIRDHENHIYDKGYFVRDRSVPMPPRKWQRLNEKKRKDVGKDPNAISVTLIAFFSVFGYIFISAFIAVTSAMDPADRLLFLTFIFLVAGIVTWIRTMIALIYVRQRSLMVSALIPLIALIAAFWIAVWNPVDDYFYYAGSLICSGASALLSVGLIKYYNLLSTRPLPSFYDRKGGNDNADDR